MRVWTTERQQYRRHAGLVQLGGFGRREVGGHEHAGGPGGTARSCRALPATPDRPPRGRRRHGPAGTDRARPRTRRLGRCTAADQADTAVCPSSMRLRASSSSAASSSSSWWASKIDASASPTSRAVRVRSWLMVRRTDAIALPSRRHSTAGSSAGVSGMVVAPTGSNGPARFQAQGLRRSAPAAPSAQAWQPPRPLTRRSCAPPATECDRAISAAWLPETRTSTSSPERTPSVAIFERLPASTHSDSVRRLRIRAWASRRRTSCTNRAAGRACSPCGLATTKLPVSSS